MSGPRVLLYRVSSETGLGHVLISLVNAAVIARGLGRALALDMRAFQYFATERHRQFFQCFALRTPPEIEVITNEADIVRLSAVTDRQTVYEQVHLHRVEHAREQVVLVRGAMLSHAYPLAAKRFPPDIRIVLRGWLAQRMAPILASFRRNQPVIGAHFRHGNGEFLHGRLDPVVFPGHGALYAALKLRYAERARTLAAARGTPDARFFVASDSRDFVDSLTALLPGAFSLARKLPEQSYKLHLRDAAHDLDILFEAAQDMWSLASCSAVLCTSSLFSRFAALNSETLAAADIVDIEAPQLDRFVAGLSTDQALTHAAAAYRAREAMSTAWLYAGALERAGEAAAAARLRRRARWHGEMAADVMLRTAQLDASEGRRAAAMGWLRLFDEYSGPNPYALRLLGALLLRGGRLPAAEAVLRRALGVDDGIASVWSQLAQLLARKGDAAAGAAAAARAVDLGASDAATLQLANRFD